MISWFLNYSYWLFLYFTFFFVTFLILTFKKWFCSKFIEFHFNKNMRIDLFNLILKKIFIYFIKKKRIHSGTFKFSRMISSFAIEFEGTFPIARRKHFNNMHGLTWILFFYLYYFEIFYFINASINFLK
jgi:hypothetical protein